MLEGIRISDYRSIGESQQISPLGKINVFVGPNNCGKSNILRFINQNLALTFNSARGNTREPIVSVPHALRGKSTTASIGLWTSQEMVAKVLKTESRDKEFSQLLWTKLFDGKLIWIDKDWPDKHLIEEASTWMHENAWRNLWHYATRSSGGALIQHWIPQTLSILRELLPDSPAVFEIPINRQADYQTPEDSKTAKVLSGRGAVRKLAAMQNPLHEVYEVARKQFCKIEEFVRVITDDHSAEISVPHSQDKILVRLNNQPFLPLSDLGSGIEQVVLHAIAATSVSDSIITFEEPELHLHPVLQRQLLKYLATQTSNQYFISTHSAQLIDTLHANVFHVGLVRGETTINYAHTDASRHKICQDLGYRASDIVQANCVIWVEGPSDRIYLNHWLSSTDPTLCEGIHYSIMFYGGKLLSHLTADQTDNQDERLGNLIRLRMLNRHIAVVIDSDKRNADQDLRATKVRVAEEIRQYGGFSWVTEGKEIENYVPTATLRLAVESVAPGRGPCVRSGKFQNALPNVKSGSNISVDKIKVALSVVSRECDLNRFDLQPKLKELCEFVRRANGLAEVNK